MTDHYKTIEDALQRFDFMLHQAGLPREQADQALTALRELQAASAQKPVAYRAWFDEDNGARWLFTLWPDEEKIDVDWQPLYTAPSIELVQQARDALEASFKYIEASANKKLEAGWGDQLDATEQAIANLDAWLEAQK